MGWQIVPIFAGYNPPTLDLFGQPYNPYQELPSVSGPPPAPTFGHPTDAEDQRVSSGYGRRDYTGVQGSSRNHPAYDIVSPTPGAINRSNATTVGSGTVKSAGWQGGYGNTVVVDHGNGYETRYSHLDSLDVKKGDKVFQGDPLGSVGNTGLKGMGYHLDFGVKKDGKTIDPGAIGYGMTPTGLTNRPTLDVPAGFAPGQINSLTDYATLRSGAGLPTPEAPPVPTARPQTETMMALTDQPPQTPALQAAEQMASPSIPLMDNVPVPGAKPEPMTVTPNDVLASYARQNPSVGTPMPDAPIPTAKPPSGAPVPTPNPMDMMARTGPTPTPNPMAMADRAPPVPTANPLALADPLITVEMGSKTAPGMATAMPGLPQNEFDARWSAANSSSTPTAAPPASRQTGLTNEPGFVQGLAPSLVERAKEMGLKAPEGQVIGYSPLAPNELTAVNPNAGPAATGPGIFGFMERDFGFGGGIPQAMGSYAAGTPGRIGGGILGGVAGTALGGPVGGLLGTMAGGYLGGRMASSMASNNAASALGQAPTAPQGFLGGLFGGLFGGGGGSEPAATSSTPSTGSTGFSDLNSYSDLTGRGGLW